MDIPFINQPNYQSTNTSIGNSGNGSKVNKPTIPRIDYNPTTEFVVGITTTFNLRSCQPCSTTPNTSTITPTTQSQVTTG